MKILYSGYNGFGQWPTADLCVSNFISLNLETYLPTQKNIESINIATDWCYNIIQVDSYIVLKGFHNGEPNKSEILKLPEGVQFTGFSCNDKYILFYNYNDKFVWKYHLNRDVDSVWTRLSNFINAELINDDISDETIFKIACGTMMNVALTSEGRLFNIPSLICTENCVGKIIDISCGHEHAMLLTDHGNVYTWGGGSRCQLGHGSIENLSEPRLVDGLAGMQIVKISAGGWHCCAISAFGDLYTWGWNERGQLGICPQKKDTQPNNEENIYSDYSNDSYDMFNDFSKPSTEQLLNTDDTAKQSVDQMEIDTNQSDNDSNYNYNLENAPSKEKRKKTSEKQSSSDDILSNYAIPMLVDIYDASNCLVLELNVVDVSCGSKHTVIKLDDGNIWGTGCNKYGQLGFDTESVENVTSFKLLKVKAKLAQIKCGSWTTVLLDPSDINKCSF